jgi:hypothetical protein
MSRTLFGRPPVSQLAKMERARRGADRLGFAQLRLLFGSFVPGFLPDHKSASGANSRRRTFTPTVTFWAFLGQVLDPDAPCRKALARVQALFASQGLALPSSDTRAYCKARRRLPVRWLLRINDFVAGRLSGGGARTVLVDGTTIVLQDTPENQGKFPQSRSQKPGCGFPLMKLVGLFDLHSGAWIAVARGSKHDGEAKLVRRLFRHLRRGDTLVGDRGFCSYAMICELSERGVDVILRGHQGQRADFRTGVRLGKNDHLIQRRRPKGRRFAHLPKDLVLRETRARQDRPGFRTREILLVTTILCVDEMTSDQLGSLYMHRWRIELFFDDIKTTMRMEMLRTKSPPMACRELLMHMIAYNLVRALVARSGADPSRASYKGTVDRIGAWGDLVWVAQNARKARELVDRLLETIAADTVPERLGRQEPRVKKRRPKPYQLLNKPREKMKEIAHRNAYKKAA